MVIARRAAGFTTIVLVLLSMSCSALAASSNRNNGKSKSPVVNNVSPAVTPAGNYSLTLSVVGANFTGRSSVLWNGSRRPTTVISSTQAQAILSNSDVDVPQAAEVAVQNTATGVTSNTVTVVVATPTVPPLTISSTAVPPGKVGAVYSTTLVASGGTTPYSWRFTSGQLPTGLAVGTNGVISGTPSVAGQFNFQVQVADSGSPQQSSVQSYTMSIATGTMPILITTTTLPSGQVGSSYSAALAATGGTVPYNWYVASGALPPGVGLTANTGALSGTPSTAGTFDVALGVQDSTGASVTSNFSIKVAAVALALQIATTSMPSGSVGNYYDTVLAATGGTPPYTWNITSGSLPSSVTLAATTGEISGTPSSAGDFTFTARVQDASQALASTALTLSVVTSPTVDQYGGLSSRPCSNATSHWTTVKQNSRWWFCTPAGHLYFWQSVGGIFVDGGAQGTDSSTGQSYNLYQSVVSKYGDTSTNWANAQARRMKSWGFNGMGQMVSGSLRPTSNEQTTKLPMFDTLMVSNYAGVNLWGYASQPLKNLRFGWSNNNHNWWPANLMDYLDPRYQTFTTAMLANDAAAQSYNNSPYFIGLFLDDTDWSWGFGAGPDFATVPAGGHNNSAVAYSVITTAPIQRFQPSPSYANMPAMYPDGKVYSKVAMTSPPATCSIATPCSLRDYLAKKYGTIGALNTAWGSTYTTFDSSGVAYNAQAVATGDGTKKQFAFSLPHTPVSPYSVALYVNNVQVGGDCPWYKSHCNIGTANTGSIMGPGGNWSSNGQPYKASYIVDSNGNLQQATTVNGLSGNSLPNWNTTQGGTTADGNVTWTNLGPSIIMPAQPWLSQLLASPASGYPAASFWAQTTYHYASGLAGSPSRQVGETASAGGTKYVATSPSYNGASYDSSATGYDVFMGCKLLTSNTPAFGCVGANYAGTPPMTLQASNVPIGTNWGVPSSGLVVGAALPSPPSSIDYNAGTVTVTFQHAPANGAQIKVDYVANGWPYGTGLMDEDGRNSWVGTNDVCLTPHAVCGTGKDFGPANANPTAGADLEAWQAQFAASYFKMSRAAMNASVPNLLYFGTDTLGTWGAPAPAQVLQGAAPYVDGLFVNWTPGLASSNGVYNFTTQYLGDKPMMNFVTSHATPDSDLYRYGAMSQQVVAYSSQAARGQGWYNTISSMLNTPSSNGSYQWIGINWWGLYDFWNEKTNWGLVSLKDNAYDGHEAVTNSAACSSPLNAYTCGGEERNFGDTITPTKAGNALWMTTAQQ